MLFTNMKVKDEIYLRSYRNISKILRIIKAFYIRFCTNKFDKLHEIYRFFECFKLAKLT